MNTAKISDAIAAMGGELVQGEGDAPLSGVSTDSRNVQPGELFFALIGENSDGHRYASTALEKGAAAVVVSQPVDVDGMVIRVDDTLVALGDFAAWYRRQFDVRVVGITGSVGKTSTKDMVAAVLARRFNVLKNAGNFNNEIGAPLTIYQLTPEHQILIQEMAMRLPGEITRLAEVVRPDVGVITNIGIAHIERLGSQDAIAAAKAELLEALPADGLAVLPAADKYFEFLSSKAECGVVSFGDSGDVRAEDVRVDAQGCAHFIMVIGGVKAEVSLRIPGEHNVANALSAAAVGLAFGVTVEEIVCGLEELLPADKRAHIIDSPNGYSIFDDTYNANPASMTSALRTVASMQAGRRIAVLGDMLELGDHAEFSHLDVGSVAAQSGLSILMTVGELGRKIAEGARSAGFAGEVYEYDTSEAAAGVIKDFVKPGDVVLVKGSRGMKMENVVEVLR